MNVKNIFSIIRRHLRKSHLSSRFDTCRTNLSALLSLSLSGDRFWVIATGTFYAFLISPTPLSSLYLVFVQKRETCLDAEAMRTPATKASPVVLSSEEEEDEKGPTIFNESVSAFLSCDETTGLIKHGPVDALIVHATSVAKNGLSSVPFV